MDLKEFAWLPSARTHSEWTDARIDILKALWVQGMSASRIAAEIGGVSRNSVIGKVHRLKLAKRISTPRERQPPKPRIHKRQRFREVPPMPIENTGAVLIGPLIQNGEGDPSVMPDQRRPGSLSCTLMELTNQTCRWPLWDDAKPEHLFCGASGADLENKLPYCPHHSRMAYQPRKKVDRVFFEMGRPAHIGRP